MASNLSRRLRAEWPAWVAIAFVAFVPFHRLMEFPLMTFVVAFFWLLRSPEARARMREALPLVGALFLCFWLPILFSSPDSYRPSRGFSTSLVMLRYLAAALSMSVLLRPPELRWLALRGMAVVLLFWALDGYFQMVFGRDLFGYPLHPDRVNALFGKRFMFYGPVLAMLAPLTFEYARQRWPIWVWALSFGFTMGAVLMAGMRAGWVMMGLMCVIYFVMLLKSPQPRVRRTATLLPVLVLVVAAFSYVGSDKVRKRVDDSLLMVQGSEQNMDEGLSWRLPIWRAAWKMYVAHPINGVGVRAYPVAYYEVAPPDDIHIVGNKAHNGGSHAHNVVLEAMSETGTIGLLGLLLGYWLAWRAWRAATPASRAESLPYVLVLLMILFPLNSHFAVFGVFTSSLIWFAMGLWGAVWRRA